MTKEVQILYIDDDPYLLDIAKQFLELVEGFVVTPIDNTTEAAILISEKKFDAIISGCEREAMDGIHLLKCIREKGDKTPFIVFTGKGQEEVVIEALNNGADCYLQKDGQSSDQFDELSNKIKNAVERRRHESDNIRKNSELQAAYEMVSAAEEELRVHLEKITRQESLLRINEQRLLMAQEIGQIGCWEYNIITKEMWVSAEGLHIFGFPSIAGYIPIEKIVACIPDRNRVMQAFRDQIMEGNPYTVDYVIYPADGSVQKTIHSVGHPEKDSNGNLFRILGVFHDITEQKRAESLLKETNEAFVQAQKIAHVGSWMYDLRTDTITWSDELYRVFGHESGSLSLKLDIIRTTIHPEDLEKHDRILKTAIETNYYEPAEYRLIYPDGSLHYITANGAVETDEKGDSVRLIGVCQDITDRKKIEIEQDQLISELGVGNEELSATYEELLGTEEALRNQFNVLTATEADLRQTKEFLENLISIANVPIIIWDPSFRIIRLNHACEILIGRLAEDIEGKSLEFLFPPDQVERSMRLFQTTRAGVRWETVEIDILHQNGSIKTILWNSATLYTPDGVNPIATIAQGKDVTEERRFEKEKDIALVQIQMNLAQLAILNDEIRNPLTIIAAYVDMIGEPRQVDPIILQIQRIDGIINHLDQRWIESEKVLNALRKHYQLDISLSPDPDIPGCYPVEQCNITGAKDQISGSKKEILLEEIQAQLYTILDSIDALVYVADMETHEILFINQRGRSRFGDVIGQKCYTSIQGQDHPCSFCTNHLLNDASDPNEVCQWEFQNTRNGKWYDCRDRAIRWTDGKMVRLEIATDITEIKTAEENLRISETRVQKKLNALLSPQGDIGILSLADIVDIPDIQILMDHFYTITGILVAILDQEGKILVAAGWQDICTKFHRVNPETCKNCIESDTKLSEGVPPGTYKLYRCKNNMWDIATPIIVGGTHLGNLFLGQFFFDDEELDYPYFIEQAKRYGFDEKSYIDALEHVPRLSRNTVDTVMQFYMQFIQLITQVSWSNIKLARTVFERDALISSVQENEKKFKGYINNAPNGIIVADNDGKFLEANPAASEITGYSEKELIRMEIFDMIPPESYEHVKEFFQIVIDSGKGNGEFLCKHKDGSLKYWSVDAARLSPSRLIGFLQDISSRKKVEESLRTSEGRLHTLVKTIPDLIWLKDIDGVYLACNIMFERLFGAHEREIIGRTDYDFVDRDLADFFRKNDRRAMAAGRPTSNEEWLTFADDGHRALMETIKTPMFDDQGTLIGVLGISRDITERQKMKEALVEAQTIIETSPVVVFLWKNNKQWSVEYVSKNVLMLFGYTAEDFISGTLDYINVIYPEDLTRVQEEVAQISADKGNQSFAHKPYRIITKNGEVKWVDDRTNIRRDENGEITHYRGTILDVTERIRGEEALHESNQKLRLLTSLTRHDIFNQLSAAEMFENLALQSSDIAKTHEYITHAMQAGEQIEKTIGFTREYENFGIVSSGWQQIYLMIESAKNEVNIGEVTISNEISHNLEVYADPIIRKVFTTLMENAFRHGEKVTFIQFSSCNQDDTLIITCIDDGVGILSEDKERIFDHGFGKHTGIGLFLVSEILSITGLSIRECGIPGKGARFEILVPAGKFQYRHSL